KMTGKREIRVTTRKGVMTAGVGNDNRVTVDMGVPVLEPADIPFIADGRATTYGIEVDGRHMEVAVVSMGNPHADLIVPDVTTAPVATLGPVIESHPRFPNRVNAGFMAIRSRNEVDLRVYERGAGETLACGSGA